MVQMVERWRDEDRIDQEFWGANYTRLYRREELTMENFLEGPKSLQEWLDRRVLIKIEYCFDCDAQSHSLLHCCRWLQELNISGHLQSTGCP